jgi:hypothetical protein
MHKPSGVDKYLQRYSNLDGRAIVSSSLSGVENAVVIPVLQERNSLFKTLASLAKNPSADLKRTVVICVVNNHPPSVAGADAVADNQETMLLLDGLIKRRDGEAASFPGREADYSVIAEGEMRMALIDASSPGLEIPERDGGVGSARKMGMDAALKILDGEGSGRGIISCLDADTLVEDNYLAAIFEFFKHGNCPAAHVAYAHQIPDNLELLSAICRYEIFLRSYVTGLMYAGSPYAFPSIGSTISCSTQSYLAVRGMNRRAVAEDFHFLDKLAKLGPIGFIGETTVHPSARLSRRVAFGTGRKMHYFLEEAKDEYLIHNPDIYRILRAWLEEVKAAPDRSDEAIMAAAKNIHPLLSEYLTDVNFPENWEMIRKNSADSDHLLRQFHAWFDGLKTLRLVHHLERAMFPPTDMFCGLTQLLRMMHCHIAMLAETTDAIPDQQKQYAILLELRNLFPSS